MSNRNIIKITSSKQKPYGALSNDSIFSMEFGTNVYKTVTNYIYSNSLHYPAYKELVKNTRVKDVRSLTDQLYKKEVDSTVSSSLYEAFKNKLIDDSLRNLLLSTGDSQIYYISKTDKLLGVEEVEKTEVEKEVKITEQLTEEVLPGIKMDVYTGKTKPQFKQSFKGENLLGIVLMNLREYYRHSEKDKNREQIKENLEDTVYDIYKAIMNLDYYSNKNASDVEKFIGKSYKDLQDINKGSYINYVDKSVIIDLYFNNRLELVEKEINNPGNLVKFYRKMNIEKIADKIKTKHKNVIFEAFFKDAIYKYDDHMKEVNVFDIDWFKENAPNIIGKINVETYKYEEIPESKHDYIYNLFLSNIDENIFIDLRERIYFLYNEEEVFSHRLKKLIKKELKKLHSIPSKKDIKKAQSFDPEITKIESYKKDTDYDIIVLREWDFNSRYKYFLPNYYSGKNFTIFNLEFPTIEYYIIFKLFTLLHNVKMPGKAYEYMINSDGNFLSIQEYFQLYSTKKKEEISNQLKEGAIVGMNKKFNSSETLQELLISTQGYHIRYIDKSPILGGKDNNFIGLQLMKIRESLINEKININSIIPNLEDVGDILLKNNYFRDWLITRITELCDVIGYIEEYFQFKYNFKNYIEITNDFIENIILIFYTPCYNHKLFKTISKKDLKYPTEFSTLVKSCNISYGSSGKETEDFRIVNEPGEYEEVRITIKEDSVIKILWNYFNSIIYGIIDIEPNISKIDMYKFINTSVVDLTEKKDCVPVILIDQFRNCIAKALYNILFKLKQLTEDYIVENFKLTDYDLLIAVKILLNKNIDLPKEDAFILMNFDNVDFENIKNVLLKIDEEVNDSMIKTFLNLVLFIDNTKLVHSNVKSNRTNFFSIVGTKDYLM